MVLARPLHVAFAACLVALSSCASSSGDDETGSEDPIYGGAVDTDGPSNGAVVALRVGDGTKADLCSATAIAPNVLLTARHCISKSVTKVVVCNSNGDSENGDHFGDDHPLSDIRIFTGSKPDFTGVAAASVKNIVRPDGKTVCNKDIALLVLDRPLENVTPMPVRLSRPVGIQETIRSVGYGRNDSGSSGTRLRKTGVVVRAVGPGLSPSETALGDNEFEVGMSICHGDSGGPAISQSTGAVIGVVSRGGECGEDFGHIYIETSGFSDLITQAIELAGAPPPSEEPPAPPTPAAAPSSTENQKSGCSLVASSTESSRMPNWVLFAGVGVAIAAFRRRR